MMLTHILQYFYVLDVAGETQCQSRQEGVVSGIQ